jgi:hypothetical protein
MNVPDGDQHAYGPLGRGWLARRLEKVPPLPKEVDRNEREPGSPDFAAIAEAMPLNPRNADRRDASLRIMSESIEVHRVKGIEFATDEFEVKRHRWEKRDCINP